MPKGYLEFCDQHITCIIDRFKEPLKNAGFETIDVIQEWNNLIAYTILFLNCSRAKLFANMTSCFQFRKM